MPTATLCSLVRMHVCTFSHPTHTHTHNVLTSSRRSPKPSQVTRGTRADFHCAPSHHVHKYFINDTVIIFFIAHAARTRTHAHARPSFMPGCSSDMPFGGLRTAACAQPAVARWRRPRLPPGHSQLIHMCTVWRCSSNNGLAGRNNVWSDCAQIAIGNTKRKDTHVRI